LQLFAFLLQYLLVLLSSGKLDFPLYGVLIWCMKV